MQLASESGDQLRAGASLPVLGQALAIVPERQVHHLRHRLKPDTNGSRCAVEGVFEAVGGELRGDDAERHRGARRDDHWLKLGYESDAASLFTVEVEQRRGQHTQAVAQIDPVDLASL